MQPLPICPLIYQFVTLTNEGSQNRCISSRHPIGSERGHPRRLAEIHFGKPLSPSPTKRPIKRSTHPPYVYPFPTGEVTKSYLPHSYSNRNQPLTGLQSPSNGLPPGWQGKVCLLSFPCPVGKFPFPPGEKGIFRSLIRDFPTYSYSDSIHFPSLFYSFSA